MCNMDCFNCTKPDCDMDELTEAERQQQDACDTKIKKERAQEKRSKLFDRARVQYDYNHSEKGKAARERYQQSEKGKAARERCNKNKIKNGKNKEYCRRYYQKKKAEREAMLCKA